MNHPRAAAAIGVVASTAAIVSTMVSARGVRSALESAYTYPNTQGVGLDEAASMTLTYLFVIGGAALIVSLLYLLLRPISQSKVGWWIGAGLAVLGLAVAIYNSTQEFPLMVKVVYFLPALAGFLWLALPEAGRPQAPREVSA